MVNKKGLSDIVATVLIVLLALAAIAIIWAFLQPTITRGGQSVQLSQLCLEMEVEPQTCALSGTTANVGVVLKRGDTAKLSRVITIVEDANGASATGTIAGTSVTLLQSATGTVTNIPATGTRTLKAAAVVKDAQGNERVCDAGLTRITCA